MDRYAVIGHPVEHSLSPRIHEAFADQTAAAMVYGRIDPGPEGFSEAAHAFFAEGGMGLNVTVPFKAQAYSFASALSERAECAGVVNTLIRSSAGSIRGDNTDGIGLVRDLTTHLGLTLAGQRILLVGAGGAVRGALAPLLETAPAEVVVANRTAARAEALARDFAALGPVHGGGLTLEATGNAFDLVINGSAASLGGQVPALDPAVIGDDCTVYDMMYGPAASAFLDWGRQHGAARIADGLGMLVEQAAESFYLWRGLHPDTAPVLAGLRGA